MSEQRDARRWSAFERMARDPAASESERAQARAQIDALRKRYPGARPRGPDPDPRRRGGAWWEGEDEPSPAEREAAATAARERRAAAVAQQRSSIERVTRWETSSILRDLRECGDVWSEEERRAYKDERVRLTGSSRAVDA